MVENPATQPGGDVALAHSTALWTLEDPHATPSAEAASLSPEQIERTIHALHVHQVELEAQNEELRRTQAELDTSRALYQDLYESAPVGYVTLDDAGVILGANLTAATLLGVVRGVMAGQPLHRFVFAPDQDIFYLHRKKLFATGTPQRCDIRMKREGGAEFWAELTGGATQSATGAWLCRVAICDISERKRAEQALRESEAKFRVLFEELEDGIALSHEGLLVDANRRLAELVGVREKNQLIGKSLLSFMTPDARARALEQSQNGFSCEGAPCAQELAFRRPDGSVVSVEMRGTRVDVGGKSHGLSIYRDITLRQRQEKERQGLEAKLLQAQKMEAVGQLAGGIAHDFNNILAAMMLQLNLLQITPAVTPDLLNETVADLLECARRAASLTRQLLLFSRRQAMTLARLDANALVVGVTNLLGRLLGEPIALVVEPNLEPLWISADASMIEQVVMNLCVNARDAMPKAGQLTISIAAVEIDAEQAKRNVNAVPGRFVCIRVMDTGDGMDAAVLQHVFEPFFTTKEVGKGTGLGLSIVHGIVTKHGGFVDVVSQIGRGTTFSVFLPRVEGLTLLPQASAALRLPGGNERILVVEDEEFVRRMAVRSLALLGYRVTEAANGHEALELWESQGGAFDLLLTDMVMPLGISGLELCTRLRQKNALLRVIIASGYSTELIQGDHASTERVTFLHKPYELEALAATVRACLDRPA